MTVLEDETPMDDLDALPPATYYYWQRTKVPFHVQLGFAALCICIVAVSIMIMTIVGQCYCAAVRRREEIGSYSFSDEARMDFSYSSDDIWAHHL